MTYMKRIIGCETARLTCNRSDAPADESRLLTEVGNEKHGGEFVWVRTGVCQMGEIHNGV